ncbi:DUF4446 family protein [Candidatus Daviesbacteria bacterium]|nr:DUF4446 family protein [Candidatus Daviesbacteria bacterium]
MYSDGAVFAIVAIAAVFIWLVGLTYTTRKQNKFFKILLPKSGERDFRKKLTEIIETVASFKSELNDLGEGLEVIRQQGLQHIQRVELLRYNPYNDTGGDQSFTLCLLNKEGSGVVITSLHARSGTRMFSKEISFGKSTRYQLSKEEELVIKKAMVNN